MQRFSVSKMHTMGCRPVRCIFHTITIDTMIIEKFCVIINGLKNATCKHSFTNHGNLSSVLGEEHVCFIHL